MPVHTNFLVSLAQQDRFNEQNYLVIGQLWSLISRKRRLFRDRKKGEDALGKVIKVRLVFF